jgi:hypothetical protein
LGRCSGGVRVGRSGAGWELAGSGPGAGVGAGLRDRRMAEPLAEEGMGSTYGVDS